MQSELDSGRQWHMSLEQASLTSKSIIVSQACKTAHIIAGRVDLHGMNGKVKSCDCVHFASGHPVLQHGLHI